MVISAQSGRWSEMIDHSGKCKVPKLEMAVVAGLSSMSVTKASSKVIGDDVAVMIWSMNELVQGRVVSWSSCTRTASAMEFTQPIVCA